MSDSIQRQLALLTMLQSVCEQAVLTFQAADNRVDDALVGDLERMIERTRVEIEALKSEIR
jgi:hypothetical protein